MLVKVFYPGHLQYTFLLVILSYVCICPIETVDYCLHVWLLFLHAISAVKHTYPRRTFYE